MPTPSTRRILTIHEAANANLVNEAQAANMAKKPLEIFRRNVDRGIYPKPVQWRPKLWNRDVFQHCLDQLAEHAAVIERGGNVTPTGAQPIWPTATDNRQWMSNILAASPYPVSDEIAFSLPRVIKWHSSCDTTAEFNRQLELRVTNFARLIPRSIWKKLYKVNPAPNDKYRHIIIPERFGTRGIEQPWHFHCLLLLSPHEQRRFRKLRPEISQHIQELVEKHFGKDGRQRWVQIHYSPANNGMANYTSKNLDDVADKIVCNFLG
jgi:hypothetical protein